MKFVSRSVVLIGLAGLVQLSQAQAQAQAPAQAEAQSAAPKEQLDEQVIEGKRLSDLRADIVKTEDRFFAAYNRLNHDREYSMECAHSAPTGSRLTQRSCVPRMVNTANAEAARNFLQATQENQSLLQEKGIENDTRKTELLNRVAGGDVEAGKELQAMESTPLENQINQSRVTGISSEMAVGVEKDSFLKHMQEMIDKNPELQKLLDEHTAAVQRYNDARKRRTTPPPEESKAAP